MPLQKSFSDQNHSGRPNARSQWQRNRSFQDSQQRPNVSAKPLAEKPPVPVSAATKNILNNFQYREQLVGEDGKKMAVVDLVSSSGTDEKENTPAPVKRIRRNPQKEVREVIEEPFLLDQPLVEMPSTPSFDPTQNTDFKRPTKAISPDDRLIWDADKDNPRLPLPRNGNLGKRKRGDGDIGRARSSSPIMDRSSPGDASALPRNLQPGPEVDIWKFAPKDHKLSHIMDMSSPHSSKDRSTPRGFTRSRSLGNSKRHQSGRAVSNGGTVDTPGLIRRLQEDFQKPRGLSGGPSSSSPLPETGYFPLDEPSSPLKAVHKRISPRKRRNVQPGSPLKDITESHSPPRSSLKRAASVESDYGSDDGLDEIGDLILTEFESQTQAALSNSLSRSLPPRQASSSPSKRQASSKNPTSAEQFNTLNAEEEDDDEFGEGLDDADFEAAFSGPTTTEEVTLPQLKSRTSEVKEISEDEFGDGINDADFTAAEIAATQSIQQTTASSLMPSMQKVRAIQRYLVTSILDSEFVGANGRQQPEKILLLQVERSKMTRLVHLRGTWIETPVTKKAFVHIIGTFDSSGRCIVDDHSNLIILHPDHLISALTVADSFGCTRRSVLQDRIKAASESAPPLVYGTILHEIFQAAMLANRWDTPWLHELIDVIAKRHLEDLYTIKIQTPQAVEHLRSKMPELQAWAELFVSSKPKPGASVQARNGDTATICISKLLDVEEHVWSPMYGLKGNIDATVQITMKDKKEQKTLTVPFEVKTGKNPSPSHRAQTALYNLLLSDRYDVEIAYGILYYMETSETIRIPAIRQELLHMIMQRNELACFVRERHAQLPPMLKKENMCGRCYAKVPCFIYHKLADDGNGETSGMKAKFDEVVGHLTPIHKEFFLKWDDLLTKEERESLKFRRELWTMLSSEREKVGRCFSNVIIEPGSAYEEQDNPKINRYRYNLIKQTQAPGFSFMDSEIIVGEPIVISDENGHFALAKGYVTNVRKSRITIAVDRRLHNARIRQPGFDEKDNQVFASIMEVAHEGSTEADSTGKIVEPPILYRLDKDEFSNGLATVRNNLIQIMSDGVFGSREIRNLVVDLKAPRFKPHSTQYVLNDRSSINVDQRRAIEKVMSAQDYALVLGMPGTGKTTTIAHIIRALVSQGKSVLLTSYTHTAVDNILLKLKNDSIPILRLGTISKIHPEVQQFAQLAVTPKESFEEIRSTWHDTPIVAASCLGINHPLFNERTFDYCIVDEASQITLPVCVGPIRMARTFILVGDHFQLPPLVKNENARKGGLDISLFKYLSDAHPQSVVYLEHQYRMNSDVMTLSNELIYNNRLKCGSSTVAERKIHIPDMDALRLHHHTPSSLIRNTSTQKDFCKGATKGTCWLRDLLDPETKVSFIDTDPLGDIAREQSKGSRTINEVESKICIQLVSALLGVGVDASEIGVMTHYRSQLALLKDGLRSVGGKATDVEMHTADRFQGRDKEVVVLSLVRSNEGGNIGELLRDWRRINVAFTRAKTKLLVVGSRGTLKGNGKGAGVGMDGEVKEEEMVSRFVRLMEERNWVYKLEREQYLGHHWEVMGTQTQASGVLGGASQWRVEEKQRDKKVKSKRGVISVEGDKENSGLGLMGNAKHNPKRIRGGLTAGNGNGDVKMGSVLMDVVNEML